MSYITVEKIDNVWNVALIEDGFRVADETAWNEDEVNAIVDVYSEDGTIEVKYI